MRRSFRYVGPPGPRMVRPTQIYTRGPAPVPQEYYSYDTYSDASYETYENDTNQRFTRHYYGAQHQEQVEIPPAGHYIPLDYPPAREVLNLRPPVPGHYTVRTPRYQTPTGYYDQPSQGVTITTLPDDYSYQEGIERTSSASTTLLALPAPPQQQSVTLRPPHPEPSVTNVVYQERVPRPRYQRPQFSGAQRLVQPAQTNQYFSQVHTAPQPRQVLPSPQSFDPASTHQYTGQSSLQALPAADAQPEQAFHPAPPHQYTAPPVPQYTSEPQQAVLPPATTHQYTAQPSRPAAPAPPQPQYTSQPQEALVPPDTTHQYQYTGQPSSEQPRPAAPAPPAPPAPRLFNTVHMHKKLSHARLHNISLPGNKQFIIHLHQPLV